MKKETVKQHIYLLIDASFLSNDSCKSYLQRALARKEHSIFLRKLVRRAKQALKRFEKIEKDLNI